MATRIFPALCLVAALPAGVAAQIRASEAATVSQTVDGTVITVAYSRPQLRGRTPGADGLIHMEHMWTPGANWATTLEVNRPITLNGHQVAAGKYSLWIEPAAAEWTVHLHPNPRLFHTAAPKAGAMMLTFTVKPEQVQEQAEVLTFDFPEVRQDGATLRFRWARVAVPFAIGVQSSQPAAMTEAEAAPYLGGWLMQMLNEVGEKSPEMRAEIVLSKGALVAVFDGDQPFGMAFVPAGEPHTFYIGFTEGERLFDVETATPVVFEVTNGKATRWYTRPVEGIGDEPWMWARRRP